MDVHIFIVPYDSALRGVRMGAGPEHLLNAGLEDHFRRGGHRVRVGSIEPRAGSFRAEIGTAFELNRILAEQVRSTLTRGEFPVVLSGNCNSAIGTLTGLGSTGTGVLWFDSHGDFNTPETTTSGFFDGMALTTLTGRCWTQLAAAIPGFKPIDERNVLLLGARDFDPLEDDLLQASEVTRLSPEQVRCDLESALEKLATRVGDAYIHIDLDVLDPSQGIANDLQAPDGLALEETGAALRSIGRRFRIRAAAFTAYDPSYDKEGRMCRAVFHLLDVLLKAVSDGENRGSHLV